jgi:hypothetical protein
MTKWEDKTRYRYNERGDIPPNHFNVVSGLIKITIIRNHVRNPDFWTMHCPALGFDTYDLKVPSDQPAEQAQKAALEIISNRIRELSEDLAKIE